MAPNQGACTALSQILHLFQSISVVGGANFI